MTKNKLHFTFMGILIFAFFGCLENENSDISKLRIISDPKYRDIKILSSDGKIIFERRNKMIENQNLLLEIMLDSNWQYNNFFKNVSIDEASKESIVLLQYYSANNDINDSIDMSDINAITKVVHFKKMVNCNWLA